MRKYFPAAIIIICLAAFLAGPAPAQEEAAEPTAATAEPAGKTLKIVTAGADEPLCGPEGLEPGPGKTVIKEQIIIPLVGMMLPIIFMLGTAAVIIVAILMAHRAAQMRYEVIQLAIKEGRELPPEIFTRMRLPRRRRDPLLGGLVLTALGIAISISVGTICGAVQGVWGLIPLLVGVAVLIYVPFYRKQKKEDEDR